MELFVPQDIFIGAVGIHIDSHNINMLSSSSGTFETLSDQTFIPGMLDQELKELSVEILDSMDSQHAENLIRSLQSVMNVLHGCIGSSDYFERAAEAVLKIAQFDCGAVLLYLNNEWKIQTVKSRRPGLSSEWQPSKMIINELANNKVTLYESGPDWEGKDVSESLSNVTAVVGIADSRFGRKFDGRHLRRSGNGRHQGGIWKNFSNPGIIGRNSGNIDCRRAFQRKRSA